MTQINIHETDIQFDADDQDTLLRAALRAGISLPYECNSGGCGSCKFELTKGEVKTLWENPPGLSKRDLRKSKLLACQCIATEDCEIKIVPEAKTQPVKRPKRFQVRYLGRQQLTGDMAEFRFQSDHPVRFLPGQYAMLKLPGVTGDRAYSMSNIPNEAGYWQFIIKKMPDGEGTGFLFNDLREGDMIELDAPYGNAYLREDNERNIALIAGGSGLSPVISIARSIAMNDRFNGRKVYLFYGGRGPDDICTPKLMDELNPLNIELICQSAVSDETLAKTSNWDGPCCFIHELVEKTLGKEMPLYEFYFCGPPLMTEAVQRLAMIDYQVPFEQIHFDRFF